MSHANSVTPFGICAKFGITGSGILLLLCSLLLPADSGLAAASGSAAKKTMSPGDIERARSYFTDTEMTTHEGKKVRFYSDTLDNRTVVVNIMYTNCEGACPMLTQKLSIVSRELGDLFGNQVHFVSVTNDAERDTPEALAEFARKQKVNLDGWTFLTGPKADIDGVIKKIGLYSPQFQQHTAMFLIGNTRTGHWQKIPPHLPPEAVAVKLKELAAEG